MTKKIIFATGGTGGHIFPAINLMKHFYEKGHKVLLVTDKRGDEFLKKYSKFNSLILKTSTPTSKKFIMKFLSFFLIFYSIIKSICILKKEKPDLIFGFGGYVSFPICFTSKFFNIPLVIYENNVILGRANKVLSFLSKKILLAKPIQNEFYKKIKKKKYEVGSILRKDIFSFSSNEKSIRENSFSILVLGGSQGAAIFGKIIPLVIKKISDQGYDIKIYQQCTKNQKNSIRDFYEKNNIKNYVFEFDKNLIKLILSTNLAITRCGASATAELAHTLTPFIAVPLINSIDNHQFLNAKYYEREGFCWILEENNFNDVNLYNLIITIIKDKNKLQDIKKKMEKKHSTNVYINIENEIKEFL